MQCDATFLSIHQVLRLHEGGTFTFHPIRIVILFSLISLFSREISTELVFLIQHMFAVFSDLIGPGSSRDVPGFDQGIKGVCREIKQYICDGESVEGFLGPFWGRMQEDV